MPKYQQSGRKYPRGKVWRERQTAARKPFCEVSWYPLCSVSPAGKLRHLGTIDHLLPEKWLRRHFPGQDPHHAINLVCLSRSEHAFKTGIDRRLWTGNDLLGFVRRLAERNWPMERVEKAFAHYGLSFPSWYSNKEIQVRSGK